MRDPSMAKASFPMQALMDRLSSSQMNLWAQYLPRELRHGDLKACRTSCKPSSGSALSKHHGNVTGGSVAGRVWELSRQPQGSREVQNAVDAAQDAKAVASMVCELQGHIWEASRCPHANHVLQKCIGLMRTEDLQFLVDELLCGNLPVQASRHKYGCRIVQQLLEHCSADQIHEFVEAIIAQASHVARHPFGNYVIQHLLSHASPERSRALRGKLQNDIRVLTSDPYGGAVLSKAMSVLPFDDKQALARSLVQDLDILASAACSRHGRPAAEAVLGFLEGCERSTVEAVLAHNYGSS